MIRKYSDYLTLILAIVGLHMLPGSVLAAANDADSRCASLVGDRFLGLVDAPTKILQARLSSDTGEIVEDIARSAVQRSLRKPHH